MQVKYVLAINISSYILVLYTTISSFILVVDVQTVWFLCYKIRFIQMYILTLFIYLLQKQTMYIQLKTQNRERRF